MKFQVAEIFESINGEGLRAGKAATFVRLSGCPLKCHYCDTSWAQATSVGEAVALETILETVQTLANPLVTITGGEPLAAQKNLLLIEAIAMMPQVTVEIETSGACDPEGLEALRNRRKNLCLTVDYKLSGSGMSHFMQADLYKRLVRGDAVKYVVSDLSEMKEVQAHIATWFEASPEAEIIISPAYGSVEPATLVDWLKAISSDCVYKSKVRIQLQLHKYIWHPEAKGV